MSDGQYGSQGNEAMRDELLQSIRNQKLVAVTGAGFSRFAAGDPEINGHRIASWDGLLSHGLQYCKQNRLTGSEKTKVIELQLQEKDTHDLIGAAQTILRWLDNAHASHRGIWLDSSIGQIKLIERGVVDSLVTISPVLFTLLRSS